MASDKQRLFAALDVPPDRLSALGPTVDSLREQFPHARFTDMTNQHVTLKFFGWLVSEQANSIVDLCLQVAEAHPPFEMSLTEIGGFPSLKRARVLWVGLSDASGRCASIAAELNRRAALVGVEEEERAFTPHLTVARLRRPGPIEEVPQVASSARRSFEVGDVVLYRSHLSPKGARYEAIQRFPLG